MSSLWAFGLVSVWLIYGVATVCVQTATGKPPRITTSQCSKRYLKFCMSVDYDIRDTVYCEEKVFKPAEATCCKVKHGDNITAEITQGISIKVSDCCGLKAFNPLNEICCRSTVIAKPALKAQCCGKEAIDEDKQLCCGRKTILTRNSSEDQCCGHDLYNTKTQCCFETKDHVLKKGSIHSQECVEELSKNSEKLREGIDEDKQLCCGQNKTILTRNSSDDQCCGHDLYNTKTQCCFQTKDHVLKKGSIHSQECVEELSKSSEKLRVVPQQKPSSQPNCTKHQTHLCGSSCYNPNEFRCCERNQAKPHWCCKGQCDAIPTVYNPHTDICCDGCVSNRRPWIDQCCGEAPYSLAQRGVLCCNNTLYKGREDGEECSVDGIPYNPAKETKCCSQSHGSPGQHCCGRDVYQPDTEICCDGHRHVNSKNIPLTCCGIEAYNIKDRWMKCCAGRLYKLSSIDKPGHDEQCCGSILHNSSSVCCSSEDKEVLYSIKTGFKCCGHLYYNSSLWSCCAGKLGPVHHPGQHLNNNINKSRLLSLNNLNQIDLCKKMHIGTVESVSSASVVFINVLKIHGRNGTVSSLALPHILKISDRCNFPKLIPGKTYFFHNVNLFSDLSDLQSLFFIFSKCH